MTPDTLDRIGRRAAAALLADLEDLDTEAALGSLLDGGAAPEPAPSPDRRSRRWIAVAAPAAAVAAVVGGLVVGGGSSDEVRTAEAPAIDPADYGPVIGRLVSQQDPNLVAEVHGPELLGAADQVAIVVTGAQPGRQYGATQCVRGKLPEINPATSCMGREVGTVGADGTATWLVRLPAVFNGTVARQVNDCRMVACDLQVDALIQDDEPDAGVPGSRFVSSDDPYYSDEVAADGASPWIPLRFDPDTEVEVPSLSVRSVGDGSAVVSGTGLAPGRVQLVAEGWSDGPPTSLMILGPDGAIPVGEAEVAADGTFTTEVRLPTSMTDTDRGTIGEGEDQQPLPATTVDCSAAASSCWVRLQPIDAPADRDGVAALLPDPVPYPAP